MADQNARDLPRIAFVFGDAALAEHVRDAVTGHADITYSVPAQEFDAARMADAQVAAALVNVDGGDWLSDIESRLDAAGVPVVFNDPDISQSLEGWDRARWLRHLTAKLCGSADFDPPRPAVVVAVPAEMPEQAVNSDSDAANDSADSVDSIGVASAPAEPTGVDSASDTVSERPLSRHEIETMTADFAAAPVLHTESAASWQPAAVTMQVPVSVMAPSVSAQAVSAHAAPAPDVGMLAEPSVLLAEPDDQDAIASLPQPSADSANDFMDVDTEALSAMIDERLAQADSSPELHDEWTDPAAAASAIDAADVAVDDAVPVAVNADHSDASVDAAPSAVSIDDPDADVLASLPSLDDWQLLDGDAIPEVVKSESRPVAPELPESLSSLTLVPMDPTGLSTPINTDPIERWIDEAEGRTKPKDDGDKA